MYTSKIMKNLKVADIICINQIIDIDIYQAKMNVKKINKQKLICTFSTMSKTFISPT